ncbi:MAG: hypothetical protein CMM15_12160, partial [Rhodospirillaceae bacterium]
MYCAGLVNIQNRNVSDVFRLLVFDYFFAFFGVDLADVFFAEAFLVGVFFDLDFFGFPGPGRRNSGVNYEALLAPSPVP